MSDRIIFSLLGAGIGALVTYFAMKDKVNKEIAKEVEKYHHDIEAQKPKAPVRDPLMSPLDPSLKAHSSIDGGPVTLDNNRTDYAAMAPNYKKSLDDIPSNAEHTSPNEEDKVYPIRMISADEFNVNSTEADVTDLIWYPETDTLTDEYDEEVEERFRLVGNCLDEVVSSGAAIETDDDGLIFVLNENVNVIYAIAVVNGDRNGGADEV